MVVPCPLRHHCPVAEGLLSRVRVDALQRQEMVAAETSVVTVSWDGAMVPDKMLSTMPRPTVVMDLFEGLCKGLNCRPHADCDSLDSLI
jgi:hypothetical protein